ncbi:sensor histidine kinase [Thalassomonas viridans]|uniref:histidine kinase n=1 Tax=Thalassomonas viridans TaxID=137584 RepID=A0AAF0CCZ5_9GAMM|nr:ATP-binding protein [Thalassomonas viridans]WDE07694.1 sensor histidine kinase [Thalassomonas viridans]
MSIRRYLVLILLSVITLVTFIAAIEGYNASMQKASSIFDAELKIVANTLIAIEAPSGEQNENLLNTGVDSNLAFQLWQGGELVLKSHNAPDTRMSPKNSGFSENNFLGQRWRTYVKGSADVKDSANVKASEGVNTSENKDRMVIIAQPVQRRFELAEDVILSAVLPIILAMPLLALFISLTIRQALKPLMHLTKELKGKKTNDLSQLQTHAQTRELEPVISTLNHLFERLSGAFERERHFASDAAHELRTPLSVLKINVHNVRNELGHESEAMTHLTESVDRMAHVVDQILMLNRTSPEQISLDSTAVNFTALIQQTISDLYPEIAQREQTISLESEEQIIQGNEFSLRILIQNLISNASKYTPSGGAIQVSTIKAGQQLVLVVEDSGPGIKPEEYQRVFNRFYRVGGDQHNSKIIGCGLGLSIVKHIALLHNAAIELSQSPELKGLKVSVSFTQENNNGLPAANRANKNGNHLLPEDCNG